MTQSKPSQSRTRLLATSLALALATLVAPAGAQVEPVIFTEDFESGEGDFRDFVHRIRLTAPPEPPEEVRSAIWDCAGGDVVQVRAVMSQKVSGFVFASPDLDFEERTCIVDAVSEILSQAPGRKLGLRKTGYLARRDAPERSRETLVPVLGTAD